jgi:hypothetical protein
MPAILGTGPGIVVMLLKLGTGLALLASIGAFLLAGVLSMLDVGQMKVRQFQIDFSSNPAKWSSDDDDYWARVKSLLAREIS